MSKQAGPRAPDNHLIHHRNRLAGLWAAELLGLIGHAAQDYVQTVIHPDHDEKSHAEHGDDGHLVEAKLHKDLAGRVSLAEIKGKMAHFLEEARHLLQNKHH